MAIEGRNIRTFAIRAVCGAGVCLGLVLASMVSLRAPATAAPSIDASPPLTISRKAPSALSAAPGMRIALVSSGEGTACYRVSRFQPSRGQTLSETFCTYE